jgi:hypothetical protein
MAISLSVLVFSDALRWASDTAAMKLSRSFSSTFTLVARLRDTRGEALRGESSCRGVRGELDISLLSLSVELDRGRGVFCEVL